MRMDIMSLDLKTLDPRYSFPFTRIDLHYNRVSNQPINQCFQINNPRGNIDYLKGEVTEFTDAFNDYKAKRDTFEHMEEELGDVLVTAAVTGESVGINPNKAMLQSLQKIQKRLKFVNQNLPANKPLTQDTFQTFWDKAKAKEEEMKR